MLVDVSLSGLFLDLIPKGKNKEMGLNLIRCFCPTKEIINKVKRQSREENKSLQIIYLIRDYYQNYINNSYSSIAKNHKQSD